MSHRIVKLIALSGLILAGNALADSTADNTQDANSPDSRIYFTPNVNVQYTDSDWNTNNGMGFGLGLGKAVSQHWNLEANINSNQQDYNAGNGSTRNLDSAVSAMYFFDRNPAFSPYAEVGAGALYVNGNGNSGTYPEANVGVGFFHWMNDIAFRADVRYRHTDGVDSYANGIALPNAPGSFSPNDWIASIGLVIPLGSKPEPAPEPVAAAPAPAPEPEPAPAPEPVAAAPAPEIARPAAHTKLVLEGTHFAFDKATLRESGKQKLDEDAKMLNAYPDIHIKISGYTDIIGTAKYNLKLSKLRAAAVMKYLKSKGVAADRMTAEGYGKADPVASNKTNAGRAKNRRVEIETLN